MAETPTHHCDIAIFGGGIAGLWAAHTLRARGYAVVLVERDTLGGGQTLAAQGILHGGQKYRLGGGPGGHTIAGKLRDQPGRWLEAIAGEAAPDLRTARVLSDHQVMWAGGGLAAKAAAAVGAKTFEGEVDALPESERPEVFAATGQGGKIYRLRETVLDVRSVVEALAAPVAGCCYRAGAGRFATAADGRIESIELLAEGGAPTPLRARAFLFAAGAGNEGAARALGLPAPATQRRPLKQVMVRGVPWTLYGHCVGVGTKPRATVTTHPGGIWYLGGNIAENAVGEPDREVIADAARELEDIFPGGGWAGREFATWDVDRAEPHTPTGKLPPDPVLRPAGNAALAWPTKLVLAPALGDLAAAWAADLCPPSGAAPAALPLPAAEVGRYPWELAPNWTRPA